MAPLSCPMKMRLLSWWYDIQEHGASTEKKNMQRKTIVYGQCFDSVVYASAIFSIYWMCQLRPTSKSVVVLTGDRVVDAGPVLSTVSLQPYPDSSGHRTQEMSYSNFKCPSWHCCWRCSMIVSNVNRDYSTRTWATWEKNVSKTVSSSIAI